MKSGTAGPLEPAAAAGLLPKPPSVACLFFQLLSKPKSYKSGFILINICFALCFDLFQNRVQRG